MDKERLLKDRIWINNHKTEDQNDSECFWKQLIPNEGHGARSSVYGHALIKAANHNVMNCSWIDTSPIGTPIIFGISLYK